MEIPRRGLILLVAVASCLVPLRSVRADPLEIDQYLSLPLSFLLTTPGGTDIVHLAGPAIFQVSIGAAGEASDTNFNGLDDVSTMFTTLNLTGFSPVLGPVAIGLNPTMNSLGMIEETVNSTPGILNVPPFTAAGTATIFFDMFFQISVGGTTLQNSVPVHVAGLITHKPPSTANFTGLFESFAPVTLLDVTGSPAGSLAPVPEPGTFMLLVFGLSALIGARYRPVRDGRGKE